MDNLSPSLYYYYHLKILKMNLSPQMNLLLKEYLISGDVAEAEHCLRDLEVPHFHHELVYEVFCSACWEI